ncbi:MAG: c-type cytochrome, partial [Pseudomonadota bacterium]
ITLVWGVGYLIFYPGFGAYAGAGGWSQQGQYEAEMAAAEARYAPLFEQYANLNTQALVSDAGALKVGRSLFANYCTQCHGSLGYGAASFPNLTDADSLYGNSFESIQASILNGRNGIMPAMGAVFADDASLDAMVEYVRNLSAGADDASPAHLQFTTVCGACHGAGGEGNVALGAPRLNDDVWLYGSAPAMIADTIRNGRNNQMPAHRKLLGEDRARLVAAYVYSLSNAPASNGD